MQSTSKYNYCWLLFPPKTFSTKKFIPCTASIPADAIPSKGIFPRIPLPVPIKARTPSPSFSIFLPIHNKKELKNHKKL